MITTAFLLGAQNEKDSAENNPVGLLVMFLNKALNGMPPSLCGMQVVEPNRTNEQSCTNQQLPQRGGVVHKPVWVGSKWLLGFLRVPVTLGTPLHFFAVLPPEQPQ